MRGLKQVGFSLVELMVALVLGSLVILAATELFMANQRLFATQQTVSRIMDDGQLLLRFMGNDIRRAGSSGGAMPLDAPIVFGGQQASSDGDPYDRLTISYVGTRDCQGSLSLVPTDIVNSYFVNNRELMCNGSLTQGSVALVSGVEGFRVQYILGLEIDDEISSSRYAGASDAATADAIVGVRIALLMAAEGGLPPGEQRTWELYDRKIEVGPDRAARRLFKSTFMLRNGVRK